MEKALGLGQRAAGVHALASRIALGPVDIQGIPTDSQM
jgi:hypothetical protein